MPRAEQRLPVALLLWVVQTGPREHRPEVPLKPVVHPRTVVERPLILPVDRTYPWPVPNQTSAVPQLAVLTRVEALPRQMAVIAHPPMGLHQHSSWA